MADTHQPDGAAQFSGTLLLLPEVRAEVLRDCSAAESLDGKRGAVPVADGARTGICRAEEPPSIGTDTRVPKGARPIYPGHGRQ